MTKEIINRKAGYQFEIIDTFQAGMQLTGTEIKSLRQGKANISEAYCSFLGDELFIRNMHIAEYERGNIYNHEPKRERKLLLTKRELKKWHIKVKERGLTIAPIKVFFSGTGYAKMEIALVKGKKTFDKRESIKERDQKRDSMRDTE